MSQNNSAFKLNEITFSCSSHSTEDLDKIKTALYNLIPENIRKDHEITIQHISGHVGNPMRLLDLTIRKNRYLKATFDFLAEKIDKADKEYLYQIAESRIDEDNCFYLRINKQDAYSEQITLDDGDNTIIIVIKFIIYKSEPLQIVNALENYGIIKKG